MLGIGDEFRGSYLNETTKQNKHFWISELWKNGNNNSGDNLMRGLLDFKRCNNWTMEEEKKNITQTYANPFVHEYNPNFEQ